MQDVVTDEAGEGIFHLEERDFFPTMSEEEIASETEKAKNLFIKIGEFLGFS